MSLDFSLYLITDRYLVGSKDFFNSIEKALEGGVSILQLREKNASSKEFYSLGIKLKKMAERFNIPLIVNDRVDIALAIDADGVHIGQEDLPIGAARKLIGRNKILGYTVSNREEAMYGEKMGADYLGAGPVYPTGSKKDAGDPIGLENLKLIKQSVNIPVVAIGGINSKNLAPVKATGVDGISVISAVLCEEDTYRAAKELGDLWRN